MFLRITHIVLGSILLLGSLYATGSHQYYTALIMCGIAALLFKN